VNQSASASELSSLKGDVRVEEPDRTQRSIARRSAEIRATVPDLELSTDIDAGPALALTEIEDCSFAAVLVWACAGALRESPWANAAYRDGRFELYSRVHIGFTIHTDGAQITPTMLDADTRSLPELTEELQRLRARARDGGLTAPELAGATFTLTDLGEFGVHRWSPLVIPPQAASLTAGTVRTAAVVRAGTVVPGKLVTLTLACDHRILFGARAATFMDRIARRMEEPAL
jgi:pyruvate dehydrogenase E2 component (dihydrolipoamide acetyltransferase)